MGHFRDLSFIHRWIRRGGCRTSSRGTWGRAPSLVEFGFTSQATTPDRGGTGSANYRELNYMSRTVRPARHYEQLTNSETDLIAANLYHFEPELVIGVPLVYSNFNREATNGWGKGSFPIYSFYMVQTQLVTLFQVWKIQGKEIEEIGPPISFNIYFIVSLTFGLYVLYIYNKCHLYI